MNLFKRRYYCGIVFPFFLIHWTHNTHAETKTPIFSPETFRVLESQLSVAKDDLQIANAAQAYKLSHLSKIAKDFDRARFIMLATNAEKIEIDIDSQPHTYAYVLKVAVWKTINIPVYFENPTPENEQERTWIRQAIADTWEKHSAVRFVGWGQADASSQGIRILLSDEQPHCKRIGSLINGVKNGMVLDINFSNWCPQCTIAVSREQAIQWIAIHEFGHALGFAHEQNRDDRDPRCFEEKQGMDGDCKLTIYDPDSIMNYCNPNWNNKGKLSDLDIKGVETLYGPADRKSSSQEYPTSAELRGEIWAIK